MGTGRKIIVCWACNEKRLHKAKGLCKRCYLFYWKREHKSFFKRYNKNHKSKKIIMCLNCNEKKIHEAHGLCKKCYSKTKVYKRKKTKKYYFYKREANRKRKLRKKQLRENFNQKEWNEKILKTKGVCPKCKKYVGIGEITCDHIIPISRVISGFVYTIEDVQPLCRSCNSSKGNLLKEI